MSTLLDRALKGEPFADLGIIDMHGHLGRFNFCIPDLSPQSVVHAMDRLGVARIVCSSMRSMGMHVESGNREVARAMQAYPGRILGYASLWPAEPQDARDEAQRCFDQGFVGLKLHNSSGFAYTDPGFGAALELADQSRRLVLLHTWGQDGEFDQVRELAARYPQAAFVLAHAGANATEQEYGALAHEFENVCLDLCMSAAPRGIVERLVAAAGVNKVVWGSDALFLSQSHQLGKVLGARVSDDDKIAILSTNAQRILDRIRN